MTTTAMVGDFPTTPASPCEALPFEMKLMVLEQLDIPTLEALITAGASYREIYNMYHFRLFHNALQISLDEVSHLERLEPDRQMVTLPTFPTEQISAQVVRAFRKEISISGPETKDPSLCRIIDLGIKDKARSLLMTPFIQK
ncbi:Hypothetical protein D9617_2g055940 [Elsinoe fawcettii]|nr:Hypothetical protein D9617_2g055940 [Elsinoe fawcettii]